MNIFTYESWGVPNSGFDPTYSFVRSHFISSRALACIRATLCIYSFTTLITCYSWLANQTATMHLKDVNIPSYTIQQGSDAIGQSFSFFTYLTFWSLGLYFLASSIHTFTYAFTQQTWLHKWPKPLQLAHSLYYSSITSFPLLVTLVFWATMNSGWPAGRFEQWINLSVHGLNSVFAITEIVVPATDPLPWSHLSVVLLVLSGYLGLAYLTRATQGFYVYEWMNPAHGVASIVLHVVGYAGSMIALFVVVRYAVVVRNMLARRVGVSSESGVGEKGMKLGNDSDTWSSTISVERPAFRGSKKPSKHVFEENGTSGSQHSTHCDHRGVPPKATDDAIKHMQSPTPLTTGVPLARLQPAWYRDMRICLAMKPYIGNMRVCTHEEKVTNWFGGAAAA
ncbi:hypothetical protein T440DRAFT_504498 [Plenodomus tracheiphilus IPT5]|uniref:Uncharacterized protein n=1 Tax=Plenodomus tracheiphilus IPT5 TaxID=1408161 RepID=A0A6A7BHS5_9PLEO|nr:hypothetical protein T440DRAFT_504498 [Plenodomus tracheiphilus IPT5]